MEETLELLEDEHAISPADVLTVSQLNSRIAETVETDPDLQTVYLLGEVSNLSASSNNHLFFDLKDEDAKVSCVVFNHRRTGLEYEPTDGDEVVVAGSVEYYGKEGRCSIHPERIIPVGEGIYYKQLKKLMAELEDEGLFAEEYKQPLPELPETVGIVTSVEGAAVRDIVNAIHERFPDVDLYIKHAAVQGDDAVDMLCDAIQFFDERFDVDVILVGRGGGSIEDLQAFNSEAVARTIFDAATPVISGVGHRTDETITGYVADYGAITPTAAGKVAVPEKQAMVEDLGQLAEGVRTTYQQFVEMKQQEAKVEKVAWRERKYQIVIAALLLIILVLGWVAL